MEEGAEGGQARQAGPSAAVLSPAVNRRALAIAGAPYAVVVAVALAVTRSFWFPGRYVVAFDTYAYSGPNLEVTERAVRAGRLPLVNDLVFAGVPHLGNPQAGALYPPRLLTLLLETNRAMGVLVALHVVVLGVGMVALSRRLGTGRLGAAAAGVVAVASGAVLTKTVQFEQILVVAWAPLLLVTVHAVLHDRRPWPRVAAVAAVTAAVLLAGHPQLVYQTMFLALAGTIGFVVGGDRWRRLPHLAAGVMLGALVALPQLVAAALATGDSALGVGRDLASLRSPDLSLEPGSVVRALLGTVQDRDQAAFAGGFESIAAVGIVAAALAIVGWVDALRDPARRPWSASLGAFAVLAVVWAAGPRSAPFRWAYDVVPGFDLARASARWLVVAVLVVALHAGIGAQVVARRVGTAQLVAVAAGVAVVAAALALGLADVADRRSAAIWAATAVALLALLATGALVRSARWRHAAGLAVLVLAIGELGLLTTRSVPQRLVTDTPFTAHHAPSSDWLAARGDSTVALTDDGRDAAYQVPGFRPNANVLAEVPSVDGYDGGVQITDRWAAALRRFLVDPPTELPLRNSLEIPIDPTPLARLGVRYVLLDRARTPADFIPGWSGPLVTDERFEVWENPEWLGEAVAWPATRVVDPGDAPDLLRTAPDTVATVALVDDPDAALACDGGDDACAPAGLDVDRRRPEHLVVRTDLDRPAVVSVARQALPGWTVEVDGEPATELVVDGLYLGVLVPAGDHEITWRYHQRWLLPTLLTALGATIAVGVLAAWPLRDAWRARGGSRSSPAVA